MPLTLTRRSQRLLAPFLALFVFAALAIVAAQPAHAQGGQLAGVQAHLLWSRYDSAAVDRQMDRAKQAGAAILRVDVGWSSIEQAGDDQWNQWYLNKLDAVVDKAEARGLKLLLTFWETPCWESTAPADLKQNCEGDWWDRKVQRYAPADANEYAEALAYTVSRYKGRVAAWEIWNEPNHPDYFKADDVVARYADMVKAGYPAAKAADPQATILAGSLADADFDFTQKLLDRGVGGNFDAWSVHPYSGDRSPLDPGPDRWIQNSFVRGVPAVRDTLLRAGQDKPLWLTEFGWSTCTLRTGPSYANCVDPEKQAQYLTLAYNQMRTWNYVQVGIWFNIQDTSDAADDRVENYGLLRYDGSAKLAYTAFATAARDVSSGPLPEGSTATTSTSSPTGTTDGTTSTTGGGGSTKKVKLRVTRTRKGMVVRGSAPQASRVTIQAFRYVKGKSGFAARASYRVSVRVDSAGRFLKVLRKSRLRKGHWRITASASNGARQARVYPRVKTRR